MILRKAEEKDLWELATWFGSELEAIFWGGPHIRFPIQVEQLKKDIAWDKAVSYSLADNKELIGFAQIFDRFGFNHLGRVAISPIKRGQKLSFKLMELILDSTKATKKDHSLFVYEDNKAARRLYESYGFKIDTYPEGVEEKAGSLFMVKKHD